MIISSKMGNLYNGFASLKQVDPVYLEWHESNKRILHKKTVSGREIICRFLNEAPQLIDGDVLFEEEDSILVVKILLCDAIVINVPDKFQLASVCYEIGNKHLPLFYDNGELLVPYDGPLYSLLNAQGYNVMKQERRLLYPLKTTVAPHGESVPGGSLFSRIMKMATTANAAGSV
jgi:urease accessory protein